MCVRTQVSRLAPHPINARVWAAPNTHTHTLPPHGADTFHKPGFKLQTRILHHLFTIVQARPARQPCRACARCRHASQRAPALPFTPLPARGACQACEPHTPYRAYGREGGPRPPFRGLTAWIPNRSLACPACSNRMSLRHRCGTWPRKDPPPTPRMQPLCSSESQLVCAMRRAGAVPAGRGVACLHAPSPHFWARAALQTAGSELEAFLLPRVPLASCAASL